MRRRLNAAAYHTEDSLCSLKSSVQCSLGRRTGSIVRVIIVIGAITIHE